MLGQSRTKRLPTHFGACFDSRTQIHKTFDTKPRSTVWVTQWTLASGSSQRPMTSQQEAMEITTGPCAKGSRSPPIIVARWKKWLAAPLLGPFFAPWLLPCVCRHAPRFGTVTGAGVDARGNTGKVPVVWVRRRFAASLNTQDWCLLFDPALW